jgi:hypothetical protein
LESHFERIPAGREPYPAEYALLRHEEHRFCEQGKTAPWPA